MQTSKFILILQKHVTEMAPFDFQIFKKQEIGRTNTSHFYGETRGQPPLYITL